MAADAHPALRERFRATIQGFVDQAVEAVNALAESLKENVQKALDLLGRGLDAALGLLEKGLHAIVDGVGAVVQGAISFAKGVVEALGAFAVLIKDIAGDPGGWLGKLGGAVMDGIQNHLWGALKTAALAWFQSKVLELLGIGGMVVQLLMEGGIDLGQIRDMAWEALQTAIPVALIAILIEKLVSMIVPAAGAVLAIIEGLQAAWGTVSRIIAAFGAFVAFLKAVKGGAAGPLFASLLAAAAVVVLDFVANWLLRKLASAARKVGAKLKAMAERFKRRRGKRGQGRGKEREGDNGKTKTKEEEKKPTESDKARVARQAAAEAERLDRKDTPARDVKSALDQKFKSRYKWIKRFEVARSSRGSVTVWMIASKKKVTDLGDKIAEELEKLVQRIKKALESNDDVSTRAALERILGQVEAKRSDIENSPKQVRDQIRELKKDVAQYEHRDEPEEGKLTEREKRNLGTLLPLASQTAQSVILARGGNNSNVRKTGRYAHMTLAQITRLVEKGDDEADTALKICKQADKKGQNY